MQTIGSVIDQLSVVNIRIWFLIDKTKDKSLSDKERVKASEQLVDVNKQRNILIDEIDYMINDAIKNGESKIFLKNKNYK